MAVIVEVFANSESVTMLFMQILGKIHSLFLHFTFKYYLMTTYIFNSLGVLTNLKIM